MADEPLKLAAPPLLKGAENFPVRLISADGVVKTVEDPAQLEVLKRAGWTPASTEKVDQLKKKYSAWYYDLAGGVVGFANSVVPGATGTALGVLGTVAPDAAQKLAQEVINIKELNSTAVNLGMGAGIATQIGVAAAGTVASGGLASPALGAAVLKGAATGAVSAAASEADDKMLAYLAGQGGTETMAWDLAGAAGVGAIVGGVVSGAANELGKRVGAKKVSQFAKSVIDKADDTLYKEGVSEVARNAAEARGISEPLKAFVLDNKLLNKSPKDANRFLKTTMAEANTAMNDVKLNTIDIDLPPDSAAALKTQMKELLVSGKGRLSSEAREFFEVFDSPNNKFNLDSLQLARSKIGKAVGGGIQQRAKDPELAGEMSQNVETAYTLINGAMKEIAEQPGFPAAWKNAFLKATDNYHYSAVLSNKVGQDVVEDAGEALVKKGAGIAGGLVGLFKAGPLGYLGGADAAERTVDFALKATKKGVAGSARLAAKAMLAVDESIVGTIINGAGPDTGLAVANSTAMLAKDFTSVREFLGMSSRQPDQFLQNFYDQLAQNGVDGVLADNLAQHSLQVHQFLETKLPKTVMTEGLIRPEARNPTKQELQQFNEYFIGVTNPNLAIQNPTPRTIEALRLAYPEKYQRTIDTINERVMSGEKLSPKYMQWAAKLSGLAAKKIAIPANNAIMNAGVQAAEAAGRAPQPFEPSNRNSDMTTSQRLGGGVNEE